MDHPPHFNFPFSVAQAEVKKIHDIHQQVWILQGKSLISTPHKEVILEMISCRNEDSLEKNKGSPIYIGIKDHKLCLFCEENKEPATLKLEEKDIMIDLYHSHKAQKPFVFYCKNTGNTSTLESAACPGWFICISNKIGEPVRMTKDVGEGNNIEFFIMNSY
ncbi:interleukin-36 alpha-like isoform X2 [Macrotis lagotis]|uniref:interleukin-36 alpha-like isoform X2 n=1 Tax=Macrotis lagotis TaxID=92651 RepID=UPI003D69E43D